MAKSVRITKTIKEDIERTIANFIQKKSDESLAGHELIKLKSDLAKMIQARANEVYPEADLLVLEKYNRVCSRETIKLSTDRFTDGLFEIYFYSYNGFLLCFDPPLRIADMGKHDSDIAKLINKDPSTLELCASIYKIHTDMQCDQTKIIKAYMTRIKVGSTIKTLLTKYPDMDKFVSETDWIEDAPVEDDKIIEQFERVA